MKKENVLMLIKFTIIFIVFVLAYPYIMSESMYYLPKIVHLLLFGTLPLLLLYNNNSYIGKYKLFHFLVLFIIVSVLFFLLIDFLGCNCNFSTFLHSLVKTSK